MKTKSVFIFSILIVLNLAATAQVEIEKSKSSLTGKNNLLVENIPESILDHFNINFYTYFFGSDAGGNNAKGNYNSVSVEAELDNFDSKLAQDITDEAYAYYVEKWKSKGITIKCPTAAEITATKQFEKDKSKGKAELLNPGAYPGGNQYAKYLTVVPSNTAQVRKEYYGNFVIGNAQFFPSDFKGNVSSSNFHFDLNFIEFKTGIGSKASITGTPGLKSNSAGSLVLWVKAKNLAAVYTNEGKGGADFYDAFDKAGKWKIKINREKYKTTAVEMIKKSIDSQMAEYEENLAKERK